MANCKSCNAEIVWIETENGKTHPVNAKPRKVFVIDRELPPLTRAVWKLVNGYESHFSTCPDASKFRKKKKDG